LQLIRAEIGVNASTVSLKCEPLQIIGGGGGGGGRGVFGTAAVVTALASDAACETCRKQAQRCDSG